MTQQTGFNLLGNSKAKILILGTMPSVRSLEKHQYYAHPRNVFWPIMMTLFNAGNSMEYSQGMQLLEAKGIAIWDVLKSCVRQGSLDSAIDNKSLEINDFISLFNAYNHIQHVFFNGSAAESLYKKNVFPLLAVKYRSLNYARLPSTSPAYAAMSYADKLAQWTVILELVNKQQQ